ncbi:MAG: hypothetical protein LBJ48_01110, partial [Coriobacteriales bacterium]|nr:hypothetical protein [Coriobacteriales bacterium]
MKDSHNSRTRAYVGRHARVATKVEEPRGEEPKGVARRLIACLCTFMLVVALIPATALTQAFANQGDVQVVMTQAYSEAGMLILSRDNKTIDLKPFFKAQYDSDGTPTWTDLTDDNGTFTFALPNDVSTNGDGDDIQIANGVLKLTGKPDGDYSTNGLAITVKWTGTGTYEGKTPDYNAVNSFKVGSIDFSSAPDYYITGFSTPTTAALGGAGNTTGTVDLSADSYTPVPQVEDFMGNDKTSEMAKSTDYSVTYAVTSGSESVLAITNSSVVGAVSGLYATGSSYSATASYTYESSGKLNGADGASSYVSATIPVTLTPGLSSTSITLGSTLETLNPATDQGASTHVAYYGDSSSQATGTWYVGADKSFTVPVTITDSLLYSTISNVTLTIADNDTDPTVDADSNDIATLNTALSSSHTGTIEIEIPDTTLATVDDSVICPIKATVTAVGSDNRIVTSTTLTNIQVVPSGSSGYTGPTATATFDGTLVGTKYYAAARTLKITVTDLLVPIATDDSSITYSLNGETQTILADSNVGTILTYNNKDSDGDQIADAAALLPNGNYDFTTSFSRALTDIWGESRSITMAQSSDPLSFIVDDQDPIAELLDEDDADIYIELPVLLDASAAYTALHSKDTLNNQGQDYWLTINLKGSSAATGYSGIKTVEYLVYEKDQLELTGAKTTSTPNLDSSSGGITANSSHWNTATKITTTDTDSVSSNHPASVGSEVNLLSQSKRFDADDEFVVYLRVTANNGKIAAVASDGTILDTQAPIYEPNSWTLPTPAAYTLDSIPIPIYSDRNIPGFELGVYDPNTASANPTTTPGLDTTTALGSGLKSAQLVNTVTVGDPPVSLISNAPISLLTAPTTNPILTSTYIAGRNLTGSSKARFDVTATADHNNIQLALDAEDFARNTADNPQQLVGGSALAGGNNVPAGSDISRFNVDTLEPFFEPNANNSSFT